MPKHLVIVESPAKAKTINKILGRDYIVKASMGHVRDLPQKEIGVDLENGFKPKYVAIKSRDKVLKELKEKAKDVESVILAPDPDREGEAIAWHLMEALKRTVGAENFQRVTYNEITAPAIREAFANPRKLDMHKVDAQQARRVLDRIVGYRVSPLLWRRIRGAASAGRVQSVALRIVCDREREILNFKPVAYWLFGAKVKKFQPPEDPFTIRLARVDGEKADVKTPELAGKIRDELKNRELRVTNILRKETSKRPQPSYITSSLQQAGNRFFGFAPTRTMRIAQKLYEGVDTGDGVVGLITYMRTDSVAVSPVAQQAAREFIANTYGAEYVPEQPHVYKSRGSAQEAHEAIRPTDVSLTPEKLSNILGPDELKLYRIIWQRFVASQMASARIAQRTAEIEAVPPGPDAMTFLFRASASDILFPGYMKVTGEEKANKSKDDEENGEDEDVQLPPLEEGEMLDPLEWMEEEKETKPPPRFTESSLVRALEENGVGRPSTYAQTVSTIVDREYVTKENRSLRPTSTGMKVDEFLAHYLPDLFDIGFTAQMEEELDEVEEGKIEWTEMLGRFYKSFEGWVDKAKVPPADMNVVNRLLGLLEQVNEWAPPTKRGKRTYSDESFVSSLREQIAAGEQQVTEKQQDAIVKFCCRYQNQIEGVPETFESLGLSGALEKYAEENKPPRDETRIKLDLLAGVTFAEPRTVGKRTYDDKEFAGSLRSQVEGGKRLTENQIRYLDRLMLKYADQIPDFEEKRKELGIEEPEQVEADPNAGEILEMLAGVKEWSAPVQRGNRTWDDHEFYTSLNNQFRTKRSLSPRQMAAMRKMAGRYADQIPGFDENAERLQLKRPQRRGGKS